MTKKKGAQHQKGFKPTTFQFSCWPVSALTAVLQPLPFFTVDAFTSCTNLVGYGRRMAV